MQFIVVPPQKIGAGRIKALFTVPEGEPVPGSYISLTPQGVAGDKNAVASLDSGSREQSYMPRGVPIVNLGTVTVMFEENLRTLSQAKRLRKWLKGQKIIAEDFQANLLLSGLRQRSALPIGTLLLTESAALQIMCPSTSCGVAGRRANTRLEIYDEAFVDAFIQEAAPYRSLLATVIRWGELQVDHIVTAVMPEHIATVQD